MRKLASAVVGLSLILAAFIIGPIQATATPVPSVVITASKTILPSGLRTKLTVTAKDVPTDQEVRIERRLTATSNWKAVRSQTLPKSGVVNVWQSPKLGPNYYRATLADQSGIESVHSRAIKIKGTLLSQPVVPTVGRKFTLSGYLPTAFKRPVQLQEKRDDKWLRIATGKTSSSGRAKLALKLSAEAKLRIYAPAVRYKHKKRPAFASPSLVVKPKKADNTTLDSDGDSLPNEIEKKLGSSSRTADTDGDGLTDQQEVVVTTDPTKEDSDSNGVADPVDDLDKDGVDNRTEFNDETKAYNPDTDGDGLDDSEEKSHKTDPNKSDTDGDGVEDGTEVKLGSSPSRADSDGDGQPDSEESYSRDVKAKDGATFEAKGPADAVASTRLLPVTDLQLQEVAGGLGAAVQVESDAPLDSGSLTIPFETQSLPANARVAVLHFDESTGTFDLPADQDVDLVSGKVTVRTTEFSPFVVVDLNQFEAIWKTAIVEPREGTGTSSKSIDAVLALDSSGSMATNDPNDDRKVAAKLFVDSLITGDLASAIDFDDAIQHIQPLTADFAAVKALIDSIDSLGGTDIGAAVKEGLDELDRNGNQAHGRVLVLLTDGDGFYDDTLTQRAKDSDTTVYTVGLGSAVNETLLQGLADATGGKFFLVADASKLPSAYNRIIGDIGAPDTDKDGLSDTAETDGWRTQRGVVYKSDPNKADTDGDGLTDGQEAGRLLTNAKWGKAYEGISDPAVSDSDGDGLGDQLEVSESTKPLQADTDSDGLDDLQETEFGSDPTSDNPDGDSYSDKEEYETGHDPMVFDLTRWDSVAAVAGGFLFGDWDFGARTLGGLNEAQRQSVEYIAGQLASGFAVFGDVRDTFSNLATGDFAGALLSVVGLIPAAGDAVKTVTTIKKFAAKGSTATKAAVRIAAKLPVDEAAKRSAIRTIVQIDPVKARVPQDIAVRGKTATVPNNGYSPNGELAKVGKSAGQADALRKDIAFWRDTRGATNIRVNQRQVDVTGKYLGINRPDFQFDLNGQHYLIEYDKPLRAGSSETQRGLDHYRRILANDPGLSEAQIILKPID